MTIISICHFERKREICARRFPLLCLYVVSMLPATSSPDISHSFDMTRRCCHSEEDGTSDVRISFGMANSAPACETPASQSLPAPRSDNSEETPTSPAAPRSDSVLSFRASARNLCGTISAVMCFRCQHIASSVFPRCLTFVRHDRRIACQARHKALRWSCHAPMSMTVA